MRSLKTDEERRFEKMGYAGGRGNGRSRTVERKRPSGGSTGSAGSTGSRRGSSKDASRRRSGSEDRRNGKMRSSPPARSASTRNFKVGGGGGERKIVCLDSCSAAGLQ